MKLLLVLGKNSHLFGKLENWNVSGSAHPYLTSKPILKSFHYARRNTFGTRSLIDIECVNICGCGLVFTVQSIYGQKNICVGSDFHFEISSSKSNKARFAGCDYSFFKTSIISNDNNK